MYYDSANAAFPSHQKPPELAKLPPPTVAPRDEARASPQSLSAETNSERPMSVQEMEQIYADAARLLAVQRDEALGESSVSVEKGDEVKETTASASKRGWRD